MFCAGLVVRELQFFALILSPLTPLFTTLLLGYRRGSAGWQPFWWLACLPDFRRCGSQLRRRE